MRTVTVPGRLRNALRGQSRPALCATGTTGAPLALASQAPPGWYSRCAPGATRVPSGNTTTQKPCARRSRPRRAMVRRARMPRERLIAIGLISARPQPKNGIHSSSRLSTSTCGGKMSWKAIVSHADWCLDRITAGRAGRFSRPSTRQSMPKIAPGKTNHQARPAGDEAVARHARQRKREKRDQRVGRRDQAQGEREQRRAQDHHGASCSANAARSANTRVPGRQAALGARLRALAGEHQHRLRAGRRRGLQVALARRRPWYVSPSGTLKRRADLEQHAGLRLAARAAGVGGVRAEEERVDAPADLRQRAHAACRGWRTASRVEQAARDARLVGRHHDAVAGLREPRDRLQAALDRLPLLGRLDVLVAVVVDGAVAVEDDRASLRELGDVGDAVHGVAQVAQQGEAVVAQSSSSPSP